MIIARVMFYVLIFYVTTKKKHHKTMLCTCSNKLLLHLRDELENCMFFIHESGTQWGQRYIFPLFFFFFLLAPGKVHWKGEAWTVLVSAFSFHSVKGLGSLQRGAGWSFCVVLTSWGCTSVFYILNLLMSSDVRYSRHSRYVKAW